MHGRQRNRAGRAGERKRDEVRLVIVRVNDVDRARTDDVDERPPDGRIERVPLADLDVLDAQVGRAGVDGEGGIALVAQVADRDRGARGIHARGARENRLLGPAARAAHASQLEDANGISDFSHLSGRQPPPT